MWTGILSVLTSSDIVQDSGPAELVSLSAVGGGAVWQNTGGYLPEWPTGAYYGDPVEHAATDPPYSGGPQQWFGLYYPYTLSVSAPGASDSHLFWVWYADTFDYPAPAVSGGTVITAREASASVVVALSEGGHMDQACTESSPPGERGVLWFGDRAYSSGWMATAATTVTVTAVCGGETLTAFGLTGAGSLGYLNCTMSLVCNSFPAADTVYARISDLAFNGYAVSLTHLDLYNPGLGTAPDPTYNPNWKRAEDPAQQERARVTNIGGIAMWWEGTGSVSGASYGPPISDRWAVTMKPDTGKFAEDVAYPDLEVSFPPFLDFVEDPPGTWTSTPKKFTGIGGPFVFQRCAWNFTDRGEDGDMIAVPVVTGAVTDSFRVANGEDVDKNDPGGAPPATADQDDKKLALLLHPLDATSLDGDPRALWGPGLTIARSPEDNLVHPTGAASRPALWMGSGGLTPGADPNNDVWVIAAHSATPKATLTLAETMTGRMALLFDHANDPPYTYHDDIAVILNLPNPGATLWAAYYPPALRIPENLWYHRDSSTWRVDFSGDKGGKVVTIRADYKWFSCSLACTSNAAYNWGTESPNSITWYEGGDNWGEWDVTLVYDAGTNKSSGYLDLRLPTRGTIDPPMHVLVTLTVTLPATSNDAEEWTLTKIAVLPWDPNTPVPPGYEGYLAHLQQRMRDPYNWYRGDYTLVAGTLDGCPVWRIPYGYEEYEGVEQCLKGRRKFEGYPSGIIADYARPLADLSTHIALQGGWEATDADLLNSAKNKDAANALLCPQLYWWDLREAYELAENIMAAPVAPPATDGKIRPVGAPVCGSMGLGASGDYTIYYRKFPQGREHALAYYSDRTRGRSTGSWWLWKKPDPDGTPALESGPHASDVHGRVRLGPGKEKDLLHAIAPSSTVAPTTGWLPFENRKYQWSQVLAYRDVCIIEDWSTYWIRMYCDGTNLRLQRRGGVEFPWESIHATIDAGGVAYDPWIEKRGGLMLICWRTGTGTEAIYHKLLSLDDGASTFEPPTGAG